MPSQKRVLIVGGGIAGQTIGPALAKRGFQSEIVEIKPSWDVIGAGMYLHSNALRALSDIGVVEEIVASGFRCDDDTTIVAGMDGQTKAKTKLRRIAGDDVPALVPIKRHTLHTILNGAVDKAGLTVRMGLTVEEIVDDPGGNFVEVRFSDGSAGSYDLVVGADGIRSQVRSLVFGPNDPKYSGFANWRVLLPRPDGLNHITWMYGAGTSVGMIPLSTDEIYVAGVTQESEDQRYEREDLPSLMREKFAAYGGFLPDLLKQVTRPEQVVFTKIEEVLQPAPWYRGRVVILGDAAHASTPFWAQGASMAIEDAIVLADELSSGEGVNEILGRWMSRRYERCVFVQSGSRKSGEHIHRPTKSALEESADRLAARIHSEIEARYARLAEAI